MNEFKPVLYNGIETNVEVTKCGRVKRVKKDWYGTHKKANSTKLGEVDFTKLNNLSYKRLDIKLKNGEVKHVKVHQLVASVFLGYKFNNFPNEVVDHIDSNILNNNLSNLRVVTHRVNASKEKTIKSGLPVGVRYNKKAKKYESYIKINNKYTYLGYYKTIEDASQAYKNKLKTIL
jgi:hypothetical protein